MKHNSFGARIRIVEFQIMGLQSQVMLAKDYKNFLVQNIDLYMVPKTVRSVTHYKK